MEVLSHALPTPVIIYLLLRLLILAWALWLKASNTSSFTERLKDSLFPALFMGAARASGEIGLLTAQIARGPETSLTNDSEGLLGDEVLLVYGLSCSAHCSVRSEWGILSVATRVG